MKRIATISAPQDIGAAGTVIYDINVHDPISRIDIIWKATNVTVSVMTAPVLRCLSRIELVDGSEVLFSLTGEEAQALNFYDRKIMPYNAISLTVAGEFASVCSIDFGRFLWDQELMFDPARYQNPQLRITWDEDAHNAGTIVNQLSVYAHVDETPNVSALTGFLMAKEVEQYAMAATAHHYVDFPTDKTIRKMLVEPVSNLFGPVALLDTIILSADNAKAVLLDMTVDNLVDIMKNEYPRIAEQYTLDGNVTIKELYANIAQDLNYNAAHDDTAITAAGEFGVPVFTGPLITTTLGVVTLALTALVSGYCPHSAIPVDFGHSLDIETWLKAENFGSLRGDILSTGDAVAADINHVVTQQLHRY